MKTRYIGRQKFIFVIIPSILICWAVAGIASEPWDAKASARVNLRTKPSSNGVILSIVPKGHKVRIMEKKGLWCKVDVEGEIHGQGWVYATYLEKILPKAPATESASQTLRVEIASGEPKQGIHPAAPPPKSRMDGDKVKPLRMPLPGKTSIAGAQQQVSARNERGETKNKAGSLPKVEISETGESAYIAVIQTLPESQTQIEETKPLNASLSGNLSMAGAQQQVSARNELRETKIDTGVRSKVEILELDESGHIDAIQTLPESQTQIEETKPPNASLSGNLSMAGAQQQVSARNERGETKNETGALPKVEISEAGESAHIAAIQTLPESQTQIEETKPFNTSLSGNLSMAGVQQQVSARNELRDAKNESIALSLVDPPLAREPVQPAVADLKQDSPGINEKLSSGIIEQGNASLHQKGLPGAEKKQNGTVQETPSPVREKAVTDAHAVAAFIERLDVFHEIIGLINGRESMGAVEIALKLLAIALSCLVIRFLYRANKIASNHYDALMQLQHSLEARQSR